MQHRRTGCPRATLTLLVLPILIAALTACAKEDVSSSGMSASLGFGYTSAAAPAAAPGSALPLFDVSADVTVDTFAFGVREIELEHSMMVDENSGVEFEGRFIVDLLAGTVTNVDSGATSDDLVAMLPPGTYHEVEFKLTPLAGVDAASPGTPTALFIAGSYNSPIDGARSFTLRLEVPFKMEVNGPEPLVIDGDGNNLLVMFRLDAMLTPTLLDALLGNSEIATETSPGVWQVVVDSGTSATSLDELTALVHDALEFGEDHNHDHDLSESEDVDDDSNGI